MNEVEGARPGGSFFGISDYQKTPVFNCAVKPTHGKHLPTDAAARKRIPLWSGLFKYFPDALVAVAKLSHDANEQHHPGTPVHWDREKSMDQEDTLLRHLLESGEMDTDGQRHTSKLAWRSLALLQLEIERDKAKES